MRIVHITPHLGGGVGKAHASLCAADPDAAGHHYVLLEEPRDRRYLEQILKTGARVSLAVDDDHLRGLMAAADIVQFEWWNHPLMCGLLAGPPLPAMRPVFWSHVSGVSAPFVPPGLIEAADRFVFTSACSRLAPNLEARHLARTEVINSGFCHAEPDLPASIETRTGISYLGTVDFTKMSPAMMQVIDRLDNDDAGVDVWGGVASDSPVHAAIAAMENPGRFRLRGHSDDPVAALSQTAIFLYLLQSFHFGTAENALVEAMSLGCAPLVFDNPCELAIVRDGETGLVARSVDHAVEQLSWMLEHPDEVARIGANARAEVQRLKTPARSIAAFRSVWEAELQWPKRIADFAAALGPTPRHWHDALNRGAPTINQAASQPSQSASKGSLAHFRAWYPDLDRAHKKPGASRA